MKSTLSLFLIVVAAVFPTLSNGQVPPDFILAVNATRHFANITTDTPLGTAIIHFSVIINNTYFQRPALYSISIVRNDQTERLFKLGNGQNDEDEVLIDPTNPLFDDFDPSNDIVILEREIIYANEPIPEDREGLPQTFTFDIVVLVVARFELFLDPPFAESSTVGVVHRAEPEEPTTETPTTTIPTLPSTTETPTTTTPNSISATTSESSLHFDQLVIFGALIVSVAIGIFVTAVTIMVLIVIIKKKKRESDVCEEVDPPALTRHRKDTSN